MTSNLYIIPSSSILGSFPSTTRGKECATKNPVPNLPVDSVLFVIPPEYLYNKAK